MDQKYEKTSRTKHKVLNRKNWISTDSKKQKGVDRSKGASKEKDAAQKKKHPTHVALTCNYNHNMTAARAG